MVGIVLVSHSRALALAVQELVRSMTGPELPLAIAAGTGEKKELLGTDAVEISEAITSVMGPEGVLVLMDMGSAILSSDTALDLLDESLRPKIKFCAAPFVEGAVAAGVTANLGASIDDVFAEAISSLKQKQAALGLSHETPTQEKTSTSPAPSSSKSIRLKILNPHGLHARPAARLINETRAFKATITVRNLSNQRGPVSIKSLSSLASLEILHDSEIEITATGDDAAIALEKIEALIKSGLGDDLSAKANPSRSGKIPRLPNPSTDSNASPVADGIAIGIPFLFKSTELEIPQNTVTDMAAEVERLRQAIAATQRSLQTHRDQMTWTAGAAEAEIYEAQMLALQDPELIESATQTIESQKTNAALAWNQSVQQITSRYKSLQDPYLRERAADWEDVGRQVLELLVAEKSKALALTEPCILVADDLTPYQVSALDKALVQGVILFKGGATAHSSILLRALGIPTIAQAQNAFTGVDLNQVPELAFDGSTGKIWLNPDASLLTELKNRQVKQRHCDEEAHAASSLPGATLDGTRCEIFANIGHDSEAGKALQSGAEGIGLLRTEFFFLERNSAPTEEEQVEALRSIALQMTGKTIIVRTLDAGGDKELPYLQMPKEDNPFLGVRAVRLCFSHEKLFSTQLRAILRAGHGHDLRIMFPMIATISDLERASSLLGKAHLALEKENIPHLWPIKKGIMIEIPSAALQAESLAEHVDFFSIGTNDLTQYTMAADRGNPALSSYQDALHPPVLRLIEMVVRAANKYQRLVAVCGEAASDEKAARILVGLGVRELSMTSVKIPRVKAILRQHKLSDLQELAQKALHCQTALEVRALL